MEKDSAIKDKSESNECLWDEAQADESQDSDCCCVESLCGCDVDPCFIESCGCCC
jgi:hypothetical protein